MQKCVGFHGYSPELIANIVQSRAKNTWLAYLPWIKKFQSWTVQRGLRSWPCSPVVAANFLSSVPSSKTLPTAWAALSFVHNLLCPFANPLRTSLCSLVVAAGRRKARPTTAKQPLNSRAVHTILASLLKTPTPTNLKLAAMINLVFRACLRISEALNLNLRDLTFHQDHISLRIMGAKTDKNLDGQSALCATTNDRFCPAILLRRYVSAAGLKWHSSEPLFQKYACHHFTGARESYASARRALLVVLQANDFPQKDFGWHSLRRGATSEALNKGISPSLVQRHGRWRSAEGMAPYIKISLKKRLQPSLSLR